MYDDREQRLIAAGAGSRSACMSTRATTSKGGKRCCKRILIGRAGLGGDRAAGARAGRLRHRRHRSAHRTAVQHQCAADRGLAPLRRAAQRCRRHQRQEGPAHHLDDQAEPSRAAANAKRLITQDNVHLLILSSLSSTYAPVVAETKRANVPLLFMGAVCPKEVYPPADALQFCTTAYAGGYDSRATLAFIKETAKEPVRIGLAAMAIPLSRGEIDYAEQQSKADGHDTGRQGGDSAADRRLHPIRHQAQGRQPQLGVLVGAVGDAGEDLRGAAPTWLAGRLHHLVAYRSGSRAGAHEGSASST